MIFTLAWRVQPLPKLVPIVDNKKMSQNVFHHQSGSQGLIFVLLVTKVYLDKLVSLSINYLLNFNCDLMWLN